MSKSFLNSIGSFPTVSTTTTQYSIVGLNIGSTLGRGTTTLTRTVSFIATALKINVSSNTYTQSMLFTLSTGSDLGTITFTTGETGEKENLDFQEIVSAPDSLYIIAEDVVAGTGSVSPNKFSIEIDTDSTSPFSYFGERNDTGIFGASVSGGTSFYGTSGSRSAMNVGNEVSSDYVRCRVKLLGSYTCSNLYSSVRTNNQTLGTIEFSILKNGSSVLTVSYGWNETGDKEDTDVVYFTSGDYISFYYYYTDTDGSNFILSYISADIYETDSKRFLCIASDTGGFSASGTHDYSTQGGMIAASPQTSLEFNTSFLSMITYVLTNTTSTDSTFVLEKNNADTDLKITYTAAQTGEKSDTDSVNISEGDIFNFSQTKGTGGSFISTLHYSEARTPLHWKPQTIFINYG